MSSPGGRDWGVRFPQFASTAAAFLNPRGCLDRRGPSLCPEAVLPCYLWALWWLVRVEISSQEAQIGHTGDPKVVDAARLSLPPRKSDRNSSFTPF